MEAELINTMSTTIDVEPHNFLPSLVAGGVAGLVVDVALFPIDTIKTRLQCERGFWRSGGFSGVYRGLAPAAAGSAPCAAIFFCVYEGSKHYLGAATSTTNSPYIHMLSACFGEVIACLIRVPVEIAKQRSQTLGHKQHMTAREILWTAYRTEGIRRGLYRGYTSTVMRELPFSLIQFPLWEYFKLQWTPVTGMDGTTFTVALCGAIAGGISAGLTTPLDVAKTRIMLAEQCTAKRDLTMWRTLNSVYRERGVRGLFAGFVPRVLWITIGGAFFFGFYDLTLGILEGRSEYL